MLLVLNQIYFRKQNRLSVSRFGENTYPDGFFTTTIIGKIMLQTVRGMRDIEGEEAALFRHLEEKAREVFDLYGFDEIRTPLLEPTELFSRGVGEETDIVSKEMYSMEDRKGQSLTLRPEGTASVVRHAISRNTLKSRKTAKYYYFGPMFRFERPQKGRYRQFHQIGAEFFGEKGIFADLEVVSMANRYLSEIGLKKRSFQINWLGSYEERRKYKEVLKAFLSGGLENLCELCRLRYERNPLRILDCKNPVCADQLSGAPEISELLSDDSRGQYREIVNLLEASGIDFQINPKLVRGLDYYCNLVFEVYADELGSQSALGGGGRYDDLFKICGSEARGAVGFALGLDRIAALVSKPPKGTTGVFVAGSDTAKNLELAEKLRASGVKAEFDASGASMKSQFKQADKLGCSRVLILGESEISSGSVSIKNMSSGEQETVPLSALNEKISPRGTFM